MEIPNIIILEESGEQTLGSLSGAFSNTRKRYHRVIRSTKVLDIITSLEFPWEDPTAKQKVFLKEFLIKYQVGEDIDDIEYIYTYGNFKILGELLFTGGTLKVN